MPNSHRHRVESPKCPGRGLGVGVCVCGGGTAPALVMKGKYSRAHVLSIPWGAGEPCLSSFTAPSFCFLYC